MDIIYFPTVKLLSITENKYMEIQMLKQLFVRLKYFQICMS